MNSEFFELTRRGLRVFPLSPGSKIPLRGSDWKHAATADAFQAYDDFAGTPGANVGWPRGLLLSTRTQNAATAFPKHWTYFGDLKTFTVSTPSGGRHFYFDAGGEQFANAVRILPNVDIRAANGYVVAPGSQIGGKRYAVADDAPIAPLPANVRALLTAKRDAAPVEAEAIGEVDTQSAIDRAITFLKMATPAIEGDGGDNHTVKVANRVADFGVSPSTALELMAEHWNDRCSPPWEYDDLERKVLSAAKSRQDPIGRDNPEVVFQDIDAPPASVDDFEASFCSLGLSHDQMAAMARRQWIIEDWLTRGYVTELVAPGGTGKSATAIGLAATIALGCGDYLGLPVKESGRVLLVNLEDDVDEMQKRLHAFEKLHSIPTGALAGKIVCFNSKFDMPALVEKTRNGLQRGKVVEDLIRMIKGRSIITSFFDPLVEMHRANENDNGEMADVMKVFKWIARSTNTSVVTVHHTGKPPKADASGLAGSPGASRGASSIGGAIRVGLTMFPMTEDEAKKLGVAEDKRRNFVRVDVSKANLSPHPGSCKWFEKVNVPLPNGEGAPAVKTVSFNSVSADYVSHGHLELAVQYLAAISANGEWERYSCKPRSKFFLPRVMASLPQFVAAGLTEQRCRNALDQLLRDGRAKYEVSGRPKSKGRPQPVRYRLATNPDDAT